MRLFEVTTASTQVTISCHDQHHQVCFTICVLIVVEISNEYEMILISSNGDLAEYEGNAMGLYQVMERKYNKASAYKQLHTLPGRQGQFIYYLPEVGGWFV